ncbi:AAA family ATPase [Pseudohalioglobus lutimaris]|uniref:Shikimate kinase n=1 Tax=Pseudohalioglobus lutimaris TaxID=1737061 RepID=A0A2N5WX79_9GAMM|nr:AAA family ATPase [Pseudohalioglobus lutimaris]PLW66830.1 shikimate kinase [Pseudohalioglobus lutimaris]
MRKILVFGNSGSGKSTIARELCDSQGLAHLDLDSLAWKPGVPPERMPLAESAREIHNFIQTRNGWVIEGCYTDLLQAALPFANEMIYMNLPVSLCIQNAKNRPWEPHKYDSPAAQDANLEMLIDWISQYDERTDTFSKQAHLALFESFGGTRTEHTSNYRSI